LSLQPTPTEPQGAIRFTARGRAGEAAVTVGTALERLPAFIVSPELEAFLNDPSDLLAQLNLSRARRPLRVEYGRYGVIAADAATDVGPFQIGVEGALMRGRTLLAAERGRVPEPAREDVAHAALRLEIVEGSEWIVALEAFEDRVLGEPEDPRRSYMTYVGGRFLRGAAGAAAFRPGALGLEVGALAMSGETYLVAPRLEWEALTRFWVEAGAHLVEGRKPEVLGTPDLSIGGIYDGIDQVFVGARWLP
jgi:hypothetical protein